MVSRFPKKRVWITSWQLPQTRQLRAMLAWLAQSALAPWCIASTSVAPWLAPHKSQRYSVSINQKELYSMVDPHAALQHSSKIMH